MLNFIKNYFKKSDEKTQYLKQELEYLTSELKWFGDDRKAWSYNKALEYNCLLKKIQKLTIQLEKRK